MTWGAPLEPHERLYALAFGFVLIGGLGLFSALIFWTTKVYLPVGLGFLSAAFILWRIGRYVEQRNAKHKRDATLTADATDDKLKRTRLYLTDDGEIDIVDAAEDADDTAHAARQ